MDLGFVMKTWMSERSYPVVTVIRDGDKVHISQEPFISDLNQMVEDNPESLPM